MTAGGRSGLTAGEHPSHCLAPLHSDQVVRTALVSPVLHLGNRLDLILSSQTSSCSLSFRQLLLLMLVRRWNGKGGTNSTSVRHRTREQATNVKPAENSFFPTLMTTLSRVNIPWDLWIAIIAHGSFSGI